MYFVKTRSQLIEAVREGAGEIMVVGGLAPETLEWSSRSNARNHFEIPEDFSFTQLLNNFNIFSIYDHNKYLIATVFQQRSEQQA